MDEEIAKADLYDILKVTRYANDKQIKRAYRKRALHLHPDKNPENDKAASDFQLLQKAFEFLSDIAKKKAYDNQLRAKDEAKERRREMDANKRQLVEDLERREENAKKLKETELEFRRIEQMRKAAQRELEEEREKLLKENELRLIKNKQEKNQKSTTKTSNSPDENKIKIKWKNEFYDQNSLRELFLKYGTIEELVYMINKKMALIEFTSKTSALEAVLCERGSTLHPLNVSWLHPPNATNEKTSNKNQSPSSEKLPNAEPNRDFESIVLMRMRQAAERERLIQQMKEED